MESPKARQAAARALAEKQERRSLQIWVRVMLGGERRSAVARSYGYQGASTITQALKRLERSALENRPLQKQIHTLRAECETYL
jgi:hypothetical protein